MPNKLSTVKGFVRMSWAPENLYNLYRLSYDPPPHISGSLSFKRSSLTLFQQKWASKKLLRAYHGDWIQERAFRRRFLPSSLPPLQQKESSDESSTSSNFGGRTRTDANDKIPLGSLMWREVEARLDVIVFRSCFAHSVYEARRLVTQGHVTLNGKRERDPNILLAPGDIISVDPTEMYLLRQSDAPFATQTLGGAQQEEASAAEETAEGSEEAAAAAATKATEGEGNAEAAEPAAAGSTTDATAATEGAETADPASGETPAAPADKNQKKTNRSSLKTKKELPGRPFTVPDYAAPFLFVPAYLEVSFATCSAIYVRHPTARPGYSEIPTPYDADGEVMRLTWEFYKNVGRRRRDLDDWGEDLSQSNRSSPATEGRDGAATAKENRVEHFDKNGKRIWAAQFPELVMERRRLRGVRTGRGRWTHRPT